MVPTLDPIAGTVDLLDPADRLHPLNAGKLAWYLALDGLTGGPTARDLIGANAGTLAGGAAWGPTTRPGGRGEIRCDGSTGQVVVAQPVATPATYSVVGWAYLSGASLTGAFVKVGGRSRGVGLGVGSGTFDSPGNHLIALAENVAWHDTGINCGTGWHHFGFAFDGANGTVAVYLDGRSAYAAPMTANSPVDADPIYIGGYADQDDLARFFAGPLDDWQLFASPLPPSDVAAIYDLSRRGYPEGLSRLAPSSGTAFRPHFLARQPAIGSGTY